MNDLSKLLCIGITSACCYSFRLHGQLVEIDIGSLKTLEVSLRQASETGASQVIRKVTRRH